MSTRRGNGEGSIYRRKDGRWVGVVSLGYEAGRRKRKHFYGKTRRYVADRMARALGDDQQGLRQVDDRVTVGRFLSDWLNNAARPGVRARTYWSYESIVREHLIPAFGRTRLAKLTPSAVQSHLNRRLADGLSPYTVRNHRAVLRRALGQAVKWGLIQQNPAALVDAPRIPASEIKPLTPDEARQLLDAIKGDRLEALYGVALALGLRQSEALGTRWTDVNVEQRSLSIRVALQRFEHAYHLTELKTARSRRVVSLPTPIVAMLRAHRVRQLEERLKAGPAWAGGEWDLVFTTEFGKPLSGTGVTNRFQALLERAGLPRQRFHDLRHCAASFMLAQGVDLRVVMEVLGHSTIAVTANTYAHVMGDLKHDAADRVAELLWGVS